MGDDAFGREAAGLDGAGRAVRADARRNLQTLLAAAKAVFTAEGVDAPMRDIAAAAGVGVGTLYRHFPRRADLIVAVFRHEVEACAEAAARLAAGHPPGEALTLWVDDYIALIATKRGLSTAMHRDATPRDADGAADAAAYDGLPAYFEDRLGPVLAGLLQAAAAAGEVRADLVARELLWAIATLCAPGRNADAATARRMVGVLMDGVRARAGERCAPA